MAPIEPRKYSNKAWGLLPLNALLMASMSGLVSPGMVTGLERSHGAWPGRVESLPPNLLVTCNLYEGAFPLPLPVGTTLRRKAPPSVELPPRAFQYMSAIGENLL